MATAYHVNLTAHSRSKGHSAVAGAAYRAGSELTDGRTGEIHDYTGKHGVEHSEIVLPADAPEWARERSALWNAAETAERRSNSTIDREFKVAFPVQLGFEERREMARAFSSEIVERHHVAVDFSMHEPDRRGDDRNYHAHVMLSTRRIGPEGFGEKAREMDSFATREEHLVHWRERWAELSGAALERAGYREEAERWRSAHLPLEKQVEVAAGRGDWSFVRDNAGRVPTIHLGAQATGLERRGVDTRLGDINREAGAAHDQALAGRAEMARRLEHDPSILLDRITDRKAVFDRRDMARELHLHVDNAAQFEHLMARLETSDKLVTLAPERTDGGRLVPARLSTAGMIETERRMMTRAEAMAGRTSHTISPAHLQAALDKRPTLSDEQRAVVGHVTADRQLAVVIGDAGTGKSFSMAAARETWEAQGYRVRGMALSAQAADQLRAGSGIESRTIHSAEAQWRHGVDQPCARDVIVVDEAGMVGSKQLGRVLDTAHQSGAKVVLIGDAKQLAAIEAGDGFRTISERVGAQELTEICRQHAEWSRQASREIARGDFRQGLNAYHERGHVQMLGSRDEAREALVSAWMRDREKAGTQAIMAHENRDVRALNEAVREARREAGELGEGQRVSTERGVREFAQGDRLVFLKNDRTLEVRNGSLGAVEKVDGDAMQVRLQVWLDDGRTVSFNTQDYGHVDHGYALTIHKEQGATVDRAHVLATPGMDRNLGYVAMTRHREEATLYAGRDDFRNYEQLSGRMERQQAKESTLDYGGGHGREAHEVTAAQDERKDEASRDLERSGEQPESRESEQQREAQAGRQPDAVERALASAREQREQREVQGQSRDAVEQALERSREQRETQSDSRQDATERALAYSQEQREAGQQAGPAVPETAGNERSDRGASGQPIRNDFRSEGPLPERQSDRESTPDSHWEAPEATAKQDERNGEVSREPARSREHPEGRQQGEAHAGRQPGGVKQAPGQREAQGGSRDAVEQALERSREQREARSDSRNNERSDASGNRALGDQEAGQTQMELTDQHQERDHSPEMGD
jgi:Ti-type conjugative transfer relaxase TraA